MTATPATPAAVFDAAIETYARYGYQVPAPELLTVPDGDDESTLLIPGGGSAAAVAYPRRILLSEGTTRGLRVTHRVMRKPTVTQRLRAWRACGDTCEWAVEVALHETAHLIQYQAGVPDGPLVEGAAQAVSIDLYPIMVRRIIGRAVATPAGTPSASYGDQVASVRALSAASTGAAWRSPAARWWRYRILGATA